MNIQKEMYKEVAIQDNYTHIAQWLDSISDTRAWRVNEVQQTLH